MKIEVSNLGVIKDAEVDLKPLTIFVGSNNAGKTWLAYTLSAILGPYGWRKYTNAYVADEIQDSYPTLETAIQLVLDEGNTKIDLVDFADKHGEKYINNVAKLAKQWMREFMSTEQALFDNLDVNVRLTETKEAFLKWILNHPLDRKLSVGRGKRPPLISVLKEAGERELFIYTSTEENVSENLPPKAVKDFVVNSVFGALHQALYPFLYIFPTERTTFITFPFSSKEILASEAPQHEQGSKAMIGPVGHFIEMIGAAFQSSLSRRKREAKNNSAIREYIRLADLLEKHILSGGVDFSTPEPEPRRELLFRPAVDVALEIPIASSMVKELSPLVLYLRYLAEKGEWLVIDEPEMNLHPEAQVRLTEFLAMLVNAGLHVLITTHSPYMVDHLANLIKAAESPKPEAIKNKFYLKRKDAFISKDNVSVYLVDHGKTENILDENGVIHWDTFSKVSDRVAELYFEL